MGLALANSVTFNSATCRNKIEERRTKDRAVFILMTNPFPF